MKYFWIGLVAFTLGCSNSPTSPSSLARVSAKSEAQSIEKGGWFDPKQLGHATFDDVPFTVGLKETPGVCYQRDFFLYKGSPLFIVWDIKDGTNQVDVAHYPFIEAHFTLSDFQNGPLSADNNPWCIPSNPPPAVPPIVPPPLPPVVPPSIPPPTLHECSNSSFEGLPTFTHTHNIDTASIIVPKGFGEFVAYLVSWGVPEKFVINLGPLPQTRLYVVTQLLHDGLNVISIQLADSSLWPAWQTEGGCWDDKHRKPPLILTRPGEYDWVLGFGDHGNFDE